MIIVIVCYNILIVILGNIFNSYFYNYAGKCF